MLLCHNVLGPVFIWSHFLVFFLTKKKKKKVSENVNGKQNLPDSLTSQDAICQSVFQSAFIYG